MSNLLPPTGGVLRVVGLSHHRAPVELRERVAVSGPALDDALVALGDGIILSTCNRTEVYRLASPGESNGPARAFFASRVPLDAGDLTSRLYHLDHLDALRHLFAVATGLDSLVVGEAQILGQLRGALDAAQVRGTADDQLGRIFLHALRVGRRARAETFIGHHAASVSYAAVELARSVLGSLRGASVLVVGAGEMGELTARTVARHGGVISGVANRTLANAMDLASRVGGRAVPLADLPKAIADADILISSTDAPGYVVTRDAIQSEVVSREDRPLLIVDIAVPRDVDPAVREIPGVHLFDIDDLHAYCGHNQEQRRGEAEAVQRIIDDEVERFSTWWRSQLAIPAIQAVRQRGEEARHAELAQALKRLRHLDAADRAVVEDLSRALVNQLLHAPTIRLKQLAVADAAEEIEAIVRAFGGEGS